MKKISFNIVGTFLICVMLLCILNLSSIAEAGVELKVRYEYQVRLDPVLFIEREKAILDLYDFLEEVDLGSHELVLEKKKFKAKKKIRKVEYFDTEDGFFYARNWKLRRRETLKGDKVQLTFKANGDIGSEDSASLGQYKFSGMLIEGLGYKQKIERDIYHNADLLKWAYSGTLTHDPDGGFTTVLALSESLDSVGAITHYFPQLPILESDLSKSLEVVEEEYHWRAELEVTFDGVTAFELTFPYSSEDGARSGEGGAIEPEISWRATAGNHEASLLLQKKIADKWGTVCSNYKHYE